MVRPDGPHRVGRDESEAAVDGGEVRQFVAREVQPDRRRHQRPVFQTHLGRLRQVEPQITPTARAGASPSPKEFSDRPTMLIHLWFSSGSVDQCRLGTDRQSLGEIALNSSGSLRRLPSHPNKRLISETSSRKPHETYPRLMRASWNLDAVRWFFLKRHSAANAFHCTVGVNCVNTIRRQSRVDLSNRHAVTLYGVQDCCKDFKTPMARFALFGCC